MDLLFLALLSGFIFYRLWTVLGTRTGVERTRKLILEEEDNIIIIPKQENPVVENRLIQDILKHDPNFDEEYFLEGAESAYRLITKAFVEGNKEKLKTFLADEPYKAFCKAIDERQDCHLEAEIVEFQTIEIDTARVQAEGDNITGQITVLFKSKQIHVTYDQDGIIIDNEAKIAKIRQDLWTFEKDLKSDNPIWILIQTK